MVRVNGQAMPAWIDWEVDNNSFYQADTFRARFAASGLPTAFGPNWWAAQPSLIIEILAGFPTNPTRYTSDDLMSLIYGQVDDLTLDPVRGLIEISGRDLTANMIDAKTTEKWPNQTASQIAVALAKRHGLTPVVTATKTKVGKYYEIDHVRLTDRRSEWDILTALAHDEGFIVYVKGRELHFEPRPRVSDNPFVIHWTPPALDGGSPTMNGADLKLSRNLTLAKDVIVQVRSWNLKQKKGFSVKATATHNKNTVLKGAAQPIGEAQVYSYTIPNLTPEQATQKAQALLRDISAHEMKLRFDGPADNLLGIANVIRLEGTGTAFDQVYFPDSIVRQMSIERGYGMTIRAKNHSPETVNAP